MRRFQSIHSYRRCGARSRWRRFPEECRESYPNWLRHESCIIFGVSGTISAAPSGIRPSKRFFPILFAPDCLLGFFIRADATTHICEVTVQMEIKECPRIMLLL